MGNLITLSKETARILPNLIRDYKAGRLGNRTSANDRRNHANELRLAKVITADISPNAEGDANLQLEDWTDGPTDIKVTNDYGLTLPVGSKLYVSRIQSKWRVVIPFIDCPE